jgi:cellulose synthase/poly-beta-1,6-N-acetylglucosamine synthase-like glycosyltransferase
MINQSTTAQHRSRSATRALTVSALVPAWNESNRIASCIESLLKIQTPFVEILVSAGGNDDTWEIASTLAGDRVGVVRQEPGEGKQRALRKLFSRASGEIIYLTDGDSIVSEATLRRILTPIINGDSEVVTGNYCPYKEDLTDPFVLYQWGIDRAVDRNRPAQSAGISGANTAITRRALIASGAFDEDVQTGTDYHLARQIHRAGIEIRYVEAPVQTRYAKSASVFLSRRARWLRNTMMHGFRFKDLPEI